MTPDQLKAAVPRAIIGGPDFGILGEGYVRLSYANSTENILKALARMNEFLSKRKAA
jgi:aspartate aminotransferase